MLEIEKLFVSYGNSEVVHGITISVAAGEIVGMIGTNGAGKSTTLGAICGTRKNVQGAISLDGVSLRDAKPDDIIRRGIALVPEGRRIFGTMTVEENLRLGATVRKDRAEVQKDIRRAYERFPVLGRYANTTASYLSGGEQQQLAISRALLSRPRLLLLDEPSLGLDPKTIELVFKTLAELRAEGMTVLVVEQNVDSVVALADRTYVLSNGIVTLSGSRAELQARGDLSDAYFGMVMETDRD